MNDGEVRLTNNKRMSTQDAKDRQRHRQSGKSMGEFGENYSYRKQYQHDYHDSSGVKWIEPTITPQGKPISGWPSEDDDPKRYEPHPIEPWIAPEKDEEGYPYRKNKERDRYYNIPITPERDIPPDPVYVPDKNDENT